MTTASGDRTNPHRQPTVMPWKSPDAWIRELKGATLAIGWSVALRAWAVLLTIGENKAKHRRAR